MHENTFPGARPPRHHVAVLLTSQQQCSSLSNLVGPAVRQVLLAQASRVAGLHDPACHARELRPALHQDKLLERHLVVPAEGFDVGFEGVRQQQQPQSP